MAPPITSAGVERGGEGGAVGDQRRRKIESTRGAVAPDTMVAAAASPGREGLLENPWGRLSPMEFLELTCFIQLAGLEPALQGVD